MTTLCAGCPVRPIANRPVTGSGLEIAPNFLLNVPQTLLRTEIAAKRAPKMVREVIEANLGRIRICDAQPTKLKK
jgi:hypothetical protein